MSTPLEGWSFIRQLLDDFSLSMRSISTDNVCELTKRIAEKMLHFSLSQLVYIQCAPNQRESSCCFQFLAFQNPFSSLYAVNLLQRGWKQRVASPALTKVGVERANLTLFFFRWRGDVIHTNDNVEYYAQF